MELGGQFVCVRDDSVVVLATGATANLVRFKWLGNHNSYLRKMGFPKGAPYPAMARLKFGDGRVGDVQHAAHIKVGVAGRGGAFTAFVSKAEIPALLPKRPLRHLEAHWVWNVIFPQFGIKEWISH